MSMILEGMGKKKGQCSKFSTLQPVLGTSTEEGLRNPNKNVGSFVLSNFYLLRGKCFLL